MGGLLGKQDLECSEFRFKSLNSDIKNLKSRFFMSQTSRKIESKAESLHSREFVMTGENFKVIQALSYEITGINLSAHKENMIYGRLARRLRALGLQDFSQYCALLQQKDSPEHHDFVNAITTNLTAFFREGHHFEFLKNTLIPELIIKNAKTRKIRVWSAGCSTGEEPYSIAMVLKSCPQLRDWDVKILATDLDSNVVSTGREGVYSIDRADSIPDTYKKLLSHKKGSDLVRMKDGLRGLIRFNQLNLLHQWPMKGPFDFIFCRNVVIYFDAETQRGLFDRYAQILQPDGHLFIGHSENLHKVCDRFDGLGRTVYKRIQ